MSAYGTGRAQVRRGMGRGEPPRRGVDTAWGCCATSGCRYDRPPHASTCTHMHAHAYMRTCTHTASSIQIPNNDFQWIFSRSHSDSLVLRLTPPPSTPLFLPILRPPGTSPSKHRHIATFPVGPILPASQEPARHLPRSQLRLAPFPPARSVKARRRMMSAGRSKAHRPEIPDGRRPSSRTRPHLRAGPRRRRR
jgi:hypothetical protein